MTVIATAGHVDHGKTSLIRALTGINTDRLEEEQRRGLTIDLGFAHVGDVSYIDVPGHVRFLRNMLAGVGSVDGCLFVVDAREGWMPQSEEHFEILRLLDVPRGVVAITKSDLVDDATLAEIETIIRYRIEGTFLADAPIVRTSIHDKESIELLRNALGSIRPRNLTANARPRLWVDRVFAPQGVGTVVTGTLLGAQLPKGTEVTIIPGDLRARIRGMQSKGVEVDVGEPGSRLAINLSGVAHTAIERGHQIVLHDQWWPADTFDAELRVLASLRQPLSRKGNFLLYVGTEELPATIRLIGNDDISPGGSGNVRIFVSRPVALAPGDRFILRETGRDETVAGGIVVEVDPRTRISRAEPTADVDAQIDRYGQVGAHEMFRRTGQTIEPTIDDVIFSSALLTSAHAQLRDMVRDAGRNGVDLAGLDDTLRQAARIMRPEHAVVENGRLYEPDLAPSLRNAGPIVEAFEANIFAPPDPASYPRDELRRLVQAGHLINLDGVFFATRAIDAAHEVVRGLFAQHPDGFTASAFREAIGSTRKFAIPLAEALDARGITRRRGDVRIPGPRL